MKQAAEQQNDVMNKMKEVHRRTFEEFCLRRSWNEIVKESDIKRIALTTARDLLGIDQKYFNAIGWHRRSQECLEVVSIAHAARAAVMSTLTSPPPPSTGGPSGPAYTSLQDALCRQVEEPSQTTRCHGSRDDDDDVPTSPEDSTLRSKVLCLKPGQLLTAQLEQRRRCYKIKMEERGGGKRRGRWEAISIRQMDLAGADSKQPNSCKPRGGVTPGITASRLVTSKQTKALQICQRKMIRKILGLSLRDGITNEELLQRTSSTDMAHLGFKKQARGFEADLGEDEQTSSKNTEVDNGPGQQEEEESGNF
ncbi:hypothetical protein ANN_08324 [Periplaneta americana]|uniref:Uncharacterized protein n=1 Tax=Periplaneta americana TaxID=6978 RepID=A0ABQ8T139_PERAM|nr:hypothetical protein ANN_08324 [Periplaneta americana]